MTEWTTDSPKLSSVMPSLSSAFGHTLTLEAFQYLAFNDSKNRSFCRSNILTDVTAFGHYSVGTTKTVTTHFLLISSCMRLPCCTAIEYGRSANVSPTSVRLQLLYTSYLMSDESWIRANSPCSLSNTCKSERDRTLNNTPTERCGGQRAGRVLRLRSRKLPGKSNQWTREINLTVRPRFSTSNRTKPKGPKEKRAENQWIFFLLRMKEKRFKTVVRRYLRRDLWPTEYALRNDNASVLVGEYC